MLKSCCVVGCVNNHFIKADLQSVPHSCPKKDPNKGLYSRGLVYKKHTDACNKKKKWENVEKTVMKQVD